MTNSMIWARFKDVKIGGIFYGEENIYMYRKLSKTTCKRVQMRSNGKQVAYGLSFWMQDSDRVFFASWNEHNANIKRAMGQSPKQKETLVRFRNLGDIARTKATLRIVAANNQHRMNLQQVKKLEDAQMVLGWLFKQTQHEMAAAKAANKMNNGKKVAA